MKRAPEPPGLYLVFMLVLSLFALALLAAGVLLPLSPEAHEVLRLADWAVCLVFFGDFVQALVRAPDRWRYFFRWGWLDLISSIPPVDYLRLGRAGRIFRILRVLRGVRSAKILAEFVLRRRADGAIVAASLVTLMLIVTAAIAMLHFETLPESNIKTGEDALWWAMATVTTVGYGDRFPITPEGRVVAVGLMITGVGLFGIFSGFVASWFLKPTDEREADEIEKLRSEVGRLREALEQQAGGAAGKAGSGGA